MCSIVDTIQNSLPLLYSMVGKLLNGKGMYFVPSDEIINTAYIKLHDANSIFSVANIKPFIFEAIREYYKGDSSNLLTIEEIEEIRNPYKQIGKTIQSATNTKICYCCKIELPVAFFYIQKSLPNGTIRYQSACKECGNQRRKMNIKRQKISIEFREIYLEKQKEYREKRKKIIANNERLSTHFKDKERERAKERRHINKAA